MRRLSLLLLALIASAPVMTQAATPTRIALVIGNSDYSSGPLPNPANDAELVSETLKKLQWVVIEQTNADQREMKKAIEEFGRRLDKAGEDGIGLFYYAGHGVQLNGRNYLIPTRADIEREGDLEIEAVSADWVIEQMRLARNGLNIVILDACRNNPFTRSMRSAERGLATMDAPTGILIAYSTAPGTVAEDGSGRNSPYTTALTQAMVTLHEPLEQLFKHVRVGVMHATQDKQVPWEYSSLTGADFCFAGCGPSTAPVPVPLPAELTPPAERSFSSALASLFTSGIGWLSSLFTPGTPETSATASVTPKPAPAGPSAVVSGGGEGSGGAAGPLIAGAAAVTLLRSLGVEAPQVDAAQRYPAGTIRELIASSPRRVTLGSTPDQIKAAFALCREYSRDCSYDDEKLRSVTLPPFELDARPVSVRAFRQFTDSTAYRTHAERVGFAFAAVLEQGVEKHRKVPGGSWRNAMSAQRAEDESPVVGVTFRDALAYCRANNSRLPTENEWEYIARGPQRNVFPWGNELPVARAMSVAPHVGDGPAGGIGRGYKGLSGAVWQWVDSDFGALKLLKGGSWLESNPANKRAAVRRYEDPDMADQDSGFRCARTVSAWPDAELWLSQLH